MHALICDDDDFVLRTLEHALRRMGYQVTVAHSALQTMHVLRCTPIRLVITDWDMPGMSGVELCQAIRREDLSGYVYLIMLSGKDSAEQRIEALSAGVDDFICKPFNRDELLACLKTAERILSLETRDLAMFALAKLAESRDPETGAHIERVQCYSRALATQLSTAEKYRSVIDGEYIRLIYQTSPLHDIGKVGIPDAILLKPGRLEPFEFEAMKAHVLIGARTLDAALQRFPNARFLQMARDIAATHHEKFNGKGYPAGLAGEQIPLSGRIVALADVYDALTSRRVYKPAMSHAQTRDLIVGERGAHFDPDVVDAFLRIEKQFVDIHLRFGEDAALDLSDVVPSPAPIAAPQRLQVMVVDDDPMICQAVCRVMSASGLSVSQAFSAADAIELASQRRPMVVIADWVMPEMNGVDLCKSLRQRFADQHIHFLMLTMNDDKARMVEAYDAGVDDFVSKPFDPRELLVRVRAGLRAVEVHEKLLLKSEGSLRLNMQLAQLNAQMEKLSMTDELTGMFNRRYAVMRLDEQWALSDRYGIPMTVVTVDIDHFKTVNDTLGHEAGDSVLRAVAAILKEQARATDIVCRFGGEEFLIIFPTETPQEAAIYANRCQAAIQARTFVVFGKSLLLTVSLGVATRTAGMHSSSDLLRAADAALYAAKRAGRNRVEIYDGQQEQPTAA